MIIDAHQHFWKYNPVRDSWIDDSMSIIKRDFLPSDLKPILKNNNVDGCIAVQADQSEQETQFLLKCAKENAFVKGVDGRLNFFTDDFDENLSIYSDNTNLKGLRYILQGKPNGFMLEDKFKISLGKLENHGLTYDILVYENQLSEVIKLVEKFPYQRFVLNHIGKPKISTGLNRDWVSNIKKLSEHENVFCKFSGMVTETENYKWKESDFFPFMDLVTESFGVDRIMYGSDWPVSTLAAKYNQVIDIIESYFKSSSSLDKNKVMGINASKFYNLNT